MADASFEQELEHRLTLIDTDRDAVVVPDLPLRDLLIIVTILVVVSAALLSWAY